MMLPAICKRLSRARLRSTIRGYMTLRRNGTIGLIRAIRNDLAERQFAAISCVSPRIFGAGVSDAETAVRQYLMQSLLGTAFNKKLLLAIGRRSYLAYPLPPEWRTSIANHGIRVHWLLSALMWRSYLCKHLIVAVFVLADVILKSLAYSLSGLTWRGLYVYFSGLSAANLPRPDASGVSYDIFSWYASWKDRLTDVSLNTNVVVAKEQRINGLAIRFSPAPYYTLSNIYEVGMLAAWSSFAAIEAVVSLVRGRWWNALLFAESIRARAVRLCPAERLPKDCLFHYSGTIYRPLWTYELEAKGGRIISYFYSTYEQPKLPNVGYESQQGNWGPATWRLYLVWDSYQDEQLRRDMSPGFCTVITGPIPFSAGKCSMLVPPKSVAVFDIELFRLSSHFPFSTLADYFAANPDCSRRFLEDVQKVLSEFGLEMLFKRKREEGISRTRKSYVKIIRELSLKSNVTLVPPEYSAMRLVNESVAVISMPFTSTALYGRGKNIPSIYYDPTGWIQCDDRAAHGIPVIIGVDQLRRWMRDNFSLVGMSDASSLLDN